MKKSLFVILALTLAALPTLAGADGFFALTGEVSKVECWLAPVYDPNTRSLQCSMAIAPDPGLADQVTVFCLDPAVAESCSAFQAGDLVMVFGTETRNTKVVDRIGVWTP